MERGFIAGGRLGEFAALVRHLFTQSYLSEFPIGAIPLVETVDRSDSDELVSRRLMGAFKPVGTCFGIEKW
jgi:hypothetical protein